MAVSRAGYQPIRAPAPVKAYGVAAKWANGGAGRTGGTASASDLFFGPKKTGTDWAAVFASANGSTQDAAFQDYVKRNVDKFSGGVLEAMLVQADLVDWYKAKMNKEIEEAQKSIKENLDGLELGSLLGERSQQIIADLEARQAAEARAKAKAAADAAAAAASAAETAATSETPGSVVDVSV